MIFVFTLNINLVFLFHKSYLLHVGNDFTCDVLAKNGFTYCLLVKWRPSIFSLRSENIPQRTAREFTKKISGSDPT